MSTRFDAPGAQTATARIITTMPESMSNNTATHTVQAIAPPSLQLGTFPRFAEPGPNEPAMFTVSTVNRGSTPATNVRTLRILGLAHFPRNTGR